IDLTGYRRSAATRMGLGSMPNAESRGAFGPRRLRGTIPAMPATILVGTQWGDEGKGKVTDFVADQMDFVVRYQGGNNAGHTVLAGERLLKLHLIPSGILYPHVTSVIAGGVVVDPKVLLDELDE